MDLGKPYAICIVGSADLRKPFAICIFGSVDLRKPYAMCIFAIVDMRKRYAICAFGGPLGPRALGPGLRAQSKAYDQGRFV